MHVHLQLRGGAVEDEHLTLLDRGEVARRLHVSRRTVERYGKAGLLDERRIGPKLVRVTEASVEALKQKDDAA